MRLNGVEWGRIMVERVEWGRSDRSNWIEVNFNGPTCIIFSTPLGLGVQFKLVALINSWTSHLSLCSVEAKMHGKNWISRHSLHEGTVYWLYKSPDMKIYSAV